MNSRPAATTRRLRLLLVVLVASSAAAPGAGSAAAMASRSGAEELVEGLRSEVQTALRRYRVPGASVALLHHGRVVWEEGFGVEVRGGRKVSTRTAFQVASLSKPVTAVAVLLLAEEGRLELDRPVWDYLSWRPPASRFDPRGVTARRLLGHRGGINIHGYPGFSPGEPLPSLREVLDGASGGAGQVRIETAPGAAAQYSSGGYALLQLLIEDITGEPFPRFMERRILRPLGMTDSGFEPSSARRMAAGHGWWGKPLPAYRFRAQGSSGLLATAGDLARFLRVLSEPEVQGRLGILGESVESMLLPPEQEASPFGLGFALETVPGARLVTHTGANRGWRSVLGAAPDEASGIAVLTNSDRGMPMTSDVVCRWGRMVADLEMASCWVERKSRGTLVAVAGLLGLGLVIDSWVFVRREVTGASRWSLAHAHPWLLRVRLSLSLLVLALWWLFWYTDTVVIAREGIENFVPVSSLPPTFSWLTLVLTLWCLLGVVRWLHARR